ncbi:MAG: 4Fe-4S binding protein [bacterium]
MRIDFQNTFYRFNPLLFITVSIASRSFVSGMALSLILVLLTLVFGRFFCGFVCPLGTIIDLFDGALRRSRIEFNKNNHRKWFIVTKSTKYVVLIFILVSALLSISFVHFFDPLVIFERFLTFVILPISTYFIGSFSNIKNFFANETVFVLFHIIGILSLGIFVSRFWCQYLCPLGGLLSILSKIAIFKFLFTKTCSECALCRKVCPIDAIDLEKGSIDAGECIICLRCQYECPEQTIKYKAGLGLSNFNIQRRHFIAASGMALVAVPLARIIVNQRTNSRLIRPPGAIPELDFLNTCIRCGKCIKVCPTNGLQPCLFESGINGLWTPRLVPRIGGCEKDCNFCGQICPTGAIRSLPLEEKTYVRIGTAVIDRSRCIAWEQNKTCLICDEACPYNAINNFNETIQHITIGRPFVDERLCTGCGICESRCPIEARSAIEVYSIGEERKKTGSYITTEKRKLHCGTESSEDVPSGFILPSE